MSFKVGVKVLPRVEVLDSQGRAVEKTLSHHGYSQVSDCRVGKYITLDVNAASESEALDEAKKVAEFVLFNPLIEDYVLEIVPS